MSSLGIYVMVCSFIKKVGISESDHCDQAPPQKLEAVRNLSRKSQMLLTAKCLAHEKTSHEAFSLFSAVRAAEL